MLLSPYPTKADKARAWALQLFCILALIFLVAPIFVPVPLSFNSGSFFTFPLAGLSTRWYELVLGAARWRNAIGNSLLIGAGATALATVLGTMTAIGLSDPKFPARRLVVPLLISPLIVPVVVTAVGTYLFYARVGLANTYAGIILAHTVLASPFVVVTVSASLTGFDRSLMRAASILGAKPLTSFFRVMMPLILPGVLSGAAFAFVTSFDEVVVVQFLADADQRTLPLEMFTGLREQLSPAITAAATLMMTLSILLLIVANLLAQRSRSRTSVIPEAAGAVA
jgi:putative spermidine/putrescine transport system permease protein